MDYEKMYKDALERAKEGKLMDEVFPELTESEDERIRKTLLRCCDDWEKGQFGCMAKEDVPAIRAYLEKQKEQKTDAKSERVIKAAKRVLNNWLDGTGCPDVSGDFVELEYAFREYDGEEKQKEQQPAEKSEKPIIPEWSEEDKRKLNRIYAILGQAADTHAFSTTCRLIGDKEAVELQDFLRSIAKLKVAEWSEEDEKKITFLERLIRYNVPEGQYGWVDGHRGGFVTKLEAISILKSLRPQPKQEWSEEEQQTISFAVDWLTKMLERADVPEAKRDIESVILGLKSLRPQPHWKPSEYTLSLVKKVADGEMLTGMEQMAMETLCDDLQKRL